MSLFIFVDYESYSGVYMSSYGTAEYTYDANIIVQLKQYGVPCRCGLFFAITNLLSIPFSYTGHVCALRTLSLDKTHTKKSWVSPRWYASGISRPT